MPDGDLLVSQTEVQTIRANINDTSVDPGPGPVLSQPGGNASSI